MFVWQLTMVCCSAWTVAVTQASVPRVNVSVDYATFLNRSDLVWEWDISQDHPAPNGWWTMAFTGNGMLGAMVTAGNSTAAPGDIGSLRVELGRSDVIDDRMPNSPHATGETTKCDRNRLPIGYFQLSTVGKVIAGSMRLRLHDAEVTGVLTTTKGTVRFTVLTHATTDVHAVNYVGTGGEKENAAWMWNARQGDSPWFSLCSQKSKGVYVGNPSLRYGVDTRSNIKFTVQPLISGASYSTAYSERFEIDGSRTLFVSTAQPQGDTNVWLTGDNTTASSLSATGEVAMALGLGWRGLRKSHRVWWHAFYQASFVTVSDPRMESFYWSQMYKLASATRGDRGGPSYATYDHTGPWFTPSDTCCPLFNWDMNLPVQYQVIFGSNHPELGYSLARLLADPVVYNDLARNVAWISTASTSIDPDLVVSGPNGIASYRFIENNGTQLPGYQTNLLWVLINVYNLYRITLDITLLPPLYSLLRASVNHQLHLAEKDRSGVYHMPLTASPEYPIGCLEGCAGGDTTYQLALTKWGLRTLSKICTVLQCDEPRQAQFDDLLQNLADFPASNTLPIGKGRGLQISRGVVVNTSHRHYSHMLPCWNTGLLSWEVPEERALCLDTLDNWHGGCNAGACARGDAVECHPSEDMTWEWDAFSYPASSAFNTRAGRSDAAWGNLTLILTTVWPERQLTWGCPHDGMAWPGSSDTKCIGASMQPNTFQGENGGDGHADPTSETPLAMAAAVQVDSLPQLLTLLVLGVSVLRTLPCGATAKGVMLFTVHGAPFSQMRHVRVQDMLLFTDDASDTFRLFWGVPTSVSEASFHQLRVGGAFLISAKMSSGTTHFMVVRATVVESMACVFFPPADWANLDLAVVSDAADVVLSKSTAHDGAWDLTGLTVTADALVYPTARVPSADDLTIGPADGDARLYNWWGYHAGGAGRGVNTSANRHDADSAL